MIPNLSSSLRSAREAYDPDALPSPAIRIGFYLFCLATSFVILALTAYTYNLDDIKIPGLFTGGSICLAYWAGLFLAGRVELPPRIIWGSYLAYVGICVLSTLATDPFAKWIGWYYVEYNIARLGYVLLGSAVITTKKMAELALKFWVLLTFITTGLGLIHYSGLLERFYTMTWGNTPVTADNRLQALVRTFVDARSMLSTILNVQFFGNFLLMTLPVAAACVVIIFRNLQRFSQAGVSTRRPMVWSVITGLTIVFTLTCIFTTYAKSSIFLLPMMLVAFAVAVYLFCGVRRIPYLGLMLLLGAVMAGTVLAFVWGDLAREVKNVEESMAPRRIIWGGAWQMFLDHPLLGVGPGGYRIYFPEYRSPDYHLTRISNVTMYAHNWLLDLMAETGALGTLAWLAFLGGICWLGFKALRRCPDQALKIAVVGTVLGIFGLLGGSATTPMSRWPVGSVALHAMMGTALGVILLAMRDPEALRPKRASAASAANPNAFKPWQYALLIAAVIFAANVTRKSARFFEAAYYHNEGLAISEGIPAHLLGDGGVIEDPRIAQFFRTAERYFEQSLALNPNSATTWYKLAAVHNRLGETEKALRDYKELQRLSPDYAEVHFNLAVIYYNLAAEAKEAGKLKEARDQMDLSRAAFERARELSNKISVWFYAANAYEVSAQFEDKESSRLRDLQRRAGELYLQCAKLPTSQVIQEVGQVENETRLRNMAVKQAAEAFASAGEWALAAEAAEENLRLNPSSTSSLQMAVQYYIRAERPDDALRVVDDRLKRNPIDGELQLNRFDALRQTGRTAEAEAHGKFLLVLQQKLSNLSKPFLTPEREAALRSALASAPASSAIQVTP